MSERRQRTASQLQLGVCPMCGKRRYASRVDARRGARLAHPGDRMQAYRCGTYWHIGHLPVRVRRGEGWVTS